MSELMPATLLEPGDVALTEDYVLLGTVTGVFLDHDRLEIQFRDNPLPWVVDANTQVRVPNQVHNG